MRNLHFQKYVLSLLTHQPCPPPEDWNGFVRFLTDEQLQGLVFHLLKHRSGIPEAVKKFSERAYYATFIANTVRIEYIRELEHPLASENIKVLILKGAALLDTTYQDLGLRPMEDIDLLVRPEDLARLKRVFSQCGYEADRRFPGMYRKNDVLIDIHTSLMHTGRIRSRSALFPMDLQQIYQGAIPWGQGFTCVQRLDEATHLIYMAHHMIKHSFSKLIWIIDFFQMVRDRDDGFWKNLDGQEIQYHQEKPLAYIFFLLKDMFQFLPPPWTVFHRQASQISWFEKALLNLKVRAHSMGDLGNLLWISCLHSRREKWGLLKETMFPATDVLRREHSETGILNDRRLLYYRCRRIIRQLWRNLDPVVKAVIKK